MDPTTLAGLLIAAWIGKEAIGEGAGLLDASLYHLGYDEHNWLRKKLDFLDELGAINSALEDYNLAPRKADTPLGETVGLAAGVLDFAVPAGQIPAMVSLPTKATKALKLAGYGSKAASILSPVGKALFPQMFPVKPVNIQFGSGEGGVKKDNNAGWFPAVGQFPGVGNMGDIVAQNLNTAASMYPHLWAAAAAEQARRDQENRIALERAMRRYASDVSGVMSGPLGYEVPAFW